MNRRNVLAAGLIFAGCLFAGCETYSPYTSPDYTPPKLKRVAIVNNPYSRAKHHIDSDIEDVLTRRGIDVVIIPADSTPPKDLDGYFTYSDDWEWDVTMYLAELEIQLHDCQTGKLLASARYKQSWMHRYPSPTDIADTLVGQILGEPPRTHPHELDNQ